MNIQNRLLRLENLDLKNMSDAQLERLAGPCVHDLSRVSDDDLNRLSNGDSRTWRRLVETGVITKLINDLEAK